MYNVKCITINCICKDVITEPPLLPLTGETLPAGSNLSDGARLDISCRNLWSPLAKALIDVRIFNPQAESNWNKSVQQMYNSHEEEKKKEYGPRVLQVEKATMTAAVMSTSGYNTRWIRVWRVLRLWYNSYRR